MHKGPVRSNDVAFYSAGHGDHLTNTPSGSNTVPHLCVVGQMTWPSGTSAKQWHKTHRKTARTWSGAQPLHTTQWAPSLWTDEAALRRTTQNLLTNLSTTLHTHAHLSTCP